MSSKMEELITKIEEAIYLASILSQNEHDKYARCVEYLIEAKATVPRSPHKGKSWDAPGMQAPDDTEANKCVCGMTPCPHTK